MEYFMALMLNGKLLGRLVRLDKPNFFGELQ